MPEEVNRILADRISDILYCPTEEAKINLLNEGFANFDSRIEVIGDVMYDAALYYAEISKRASNIVRELSLKEYALCTLHRAENTDDKSKLESICRALNELSKELEIVIPIHPRTKKMLEKFNLNLNVKLIEPVGYFDMISLLENARLIITDSGGLQKEAYFFNKPCVTMREQTEWVELIQAGVNVLAGSDEKLILSSAKEMLVRECSFEAKFYGDGKASDKIAMDLLKTVNV